MKLLKCITIAKSPDGRPYLMAFPINKIEKIESIFGGENVYLKINGIEVEGSYNDLIETLNTA